MNIRYRGAEAKWPPSYALSWTTCPFWTKCPEVWPIVKRSVDTVKCVSHIFDMIERWGGNFNKGDRPLCKNRFTRNQKGNTNKYSVTTGRFKGNKWTAIHLSVWFHLFVFLCRTASPSPVARPVQKPLRAFFVLVAQPRFWLSPWLFGAAFILHYALSPLSYRRILGTSAYLTCWLCQLIYTMIHANAWLSYCYVEMLLSWPPPHGTVWSYFETYRYFLTAREICPSPLEQISSALYQCELELTNVGHMLRPTALPRPPQLDSQENPLQDWLRGEWSLFDWSNPLMWWNLFGMCHCIVSVWLWTLTIGHFRIPTWQKGGLCAEFQWCLFKLWFFSFSHVRIGDVYVFML